MSMTRESLSARRAWIEMRRRSRSYSSPRSRSPQGERGLKLEAQKVLMIDRVVALRKESVD